MASDLREVPTAILRAYGWRGLARRAAYEAQLRSGLIRRQLPIEDALAPAPGWRWPLRFDLHELRAQYQELPELDRIRDDAVERTERLLSGEMRFYGWAWHDVGWPPRWHVNPWTGFEYPRAHWSEIPDDRPEWGDIKDVWEMSRWSWTCLLARAYVLTGDSRYVKAWWEAVENWIHSNPPNLGVNWRCGQETSLRAIMLQFGLCTFGNHSVSTDARLDLGAGLLRASAQRVGQTLHYAMSQRNNHAISESVFLSTLSVAGLLPPDASDRARRTLTEAIDDQFYSDGWYAQSSVNYQRLAVHAIEWLTRVIGMAGGSASDTLRVVLARSRSLLRLVQDPVSGFMPNLGANDGALLFELSARDRMDFRPFLTGGAGYWSEEAVWLRSKSTEVNLGKIEDPSHLSVFDGERIHAVIRTGVGHHRVSQDDLLHLDVWIDGVNVLTDPGTYRYTAPAPWDNPFTSCHVHNSPCLAGTNLRRIGRFLQISNPKISVDHKGTAVHLTRSTPHGSIERRVLRSGDVLEVIDEADSKLPLTVSWNVRPPTTIWRRDDHTEIRGRHVHIQLYGKVRSVSRDDASPRSGWMSPGYGDVAPVDRFELSPAKLGGQTRSLIAPPGML